LYSNLVSWFGIGGRLWYSTITVIFLPIFLGYQFCYALLLFSHNKHRKKIQHIMIHQTIRIQNNYNPFDIPICVWCFK
jgi:hypothetical protein